MHDLVTFLEKQAKMLQDPVFGSIHDPLSNVKSKSGAEAKSSYYKSKGSSFATTVAIVPGNKSSQERPPFKDRVNMSSSADVTSCPFCAGKHSLADCLKMNKQPHEAKIEYIRQHGLCFGCLRVGHLSKMCKTRMTCQQCQAKHPTILHIKSPTRPAVAGSNSKVDQKAAVSKPEETSLSSALVSLEGGERTGKDCLLAIVPVQVKLCNGSKGVLTYAFLDPGSTDTFCTEKLMRQLNARGRRTDVLLQTMGTEKVVKSCELDGLEVGNLEGGSFLKLPKLYTQNKIPVTKRNIPRQNLTNGLTYRRSK